MQATSLKPVVEILVRGTADAPGIALCEYEDNNQVIRLPAESQSPRTWDCGYMRRFADSPHRPTAQGF